MGGRKCFRCGDTYPATKGAGVKCPVCDNVLQYVVHEYPDTDWPPEIPDKLPDMTPEVASEINEAWARLKAEARRRGPSWSIADLIGEKWTV